MFGKQDEKPQADAFVNNLAIVGSNGTEYPMGLNKSVLPLFAEGSEIHKALAEEAHKNGGEVKVKLTATIRLNTRKHGSNETVDMSGVSFGLASETETAKPAASVEEEEQPAVANG